MPSWCLAPHLLLAWSLRSAKPHRHVLTSFNFLFILVHGKKPKTKKKSTRVLFSIVLLNQSTKLVLMNFLMGILLWENDPYCFLKCMMCSFKQWGTIILSSMAIKRKVVNLKYITIDHWLVVSQLSSRIKKNGTRRLGLLPNCIIYVYKCSKPNSGYTINAAATTILHFELKLWWDIRNKANAYLGVFGLKIHRSGDMEHSGAALNGCIKASLVGQVSLPQRQVRLGLWQVQQMLHLLLIRCYKKNINHESLTRK